jgi:conjugative transfer signal peptidase TraF
MLGRIAIAGGCILLCGLSGAVQAGFRVNLTPSMPKGLWHVQPVATVHRGDTVVVCAPPLETSEGLERGYIGAGGCPGGSEPLLKPVAAVAGDVVSVGRDVVAVNGQALPDVVPLTHDSAGRPLFGVAPGNYRVRDGEVWVVSSHVPNSWDSRYWGAVSLAGIQGRAEPVWVAP